MLTMVNQNAATTMARTTAITIKKNTGFDEGDGGLRFSVTAFLSGCDLAATLKVSNPRPINGATHVRACDPVVRWLMFGQCPKSAALDCEAHEFISKKPHAQITVSTERTATITAKPHFVLMISPNPGGNVWAGT